MRSRESQTTISATPVIVRSILSAENGLHEPYRFTALPLYRLVAAYEIGPHEFVKLLIG